MGQGSTGASLYRLCRRTPDRGRALKHRAMPTHAALEPSSLPDSNIRASSLTMSHAHQSPASQSGTSPTSERSARDAGIQPASRKRSRTDLVDVEPRRVMHRYRASIACVICRGRKTKCDGRRPVCSYCQRTGSACAYDFGDGSAPGLEGCVLYKSMRSASGIADENAPPETLNEC